MFNLKHIYLGYNKLQYIQPDTFLVLPNLQHVYTYSNRGLQIPTDRNYVNSHSLSFLGLTYCNVISVSVETFANLSALERIELNYNNQRSVDINILIALVKCPQFSPKKSLYIVTVSYRKCGFGVRIMTYRNHLGEKRRYLTCRAR